MDDFDIPYLGPMLMAALDPRVLLGHPFVYRSFSTLIEGTDMRQTYVAEHIRARPGDRILDIGCGPADMLRFLPDVDYYGFDLNASYIAAAEKRYGTKGHFFNRKVDEEFLPGEPHSFDIVNAHGIVHHLDDNEAKSLFRLAAQALKPGGRLITRDGCYNTDQNRFAHWLLSRDRGDYVRDADGYLALAKSIFPNVRHSLYHHLLRLPYTHIVLECTTD